MKKIILSLLIVLTCFTLEAQENEITTYYFIRHAEKDRSDANNRNPELTKVGHDRALYWSEVFKNIAFDLIYSTAYNRTQQTAAPTAMKKGLNVDSYDPRDMYSAVFQKDTKGKTVLVVGHSNTTPAFVNKVLGTKTYGDIDDSNNGNLYIVTGNAGAFTATLLTINPR